MYIKKKVFPSGVVDKNSLGQCRGHRFSPQSWKIPHAMAQLSLHATNSEAHTP